MPDFVAFTLVFGFLLVLLGPIVLIALHAVGVAWTYRLGFRMGTFTAAAPDTIKHESTDRVRVRRRGDRLLISEQPWGINPTRTFFVAGLPDQLMGIIDGATAPRLTLRADVGSSMLWVLLSGLSAVAVWALATWMPGVRSVEGVLFTIGMGASSAGYVAWLVRRTRQRVGTLAAYLGFDT